LLLTAEAVFFSEHGHIDTDDTDQPTMASATANVLIQGIAWQNAKHPADSMWLWA